MNNVSRSSSSGFFSSLSTLFTDVIENFNDNVIDPTVDAIYEAVDPDHKKLKEKLENTSKALAIAINVGMFAAIFFTSVAILFGSIGSLIMAAVSFFAVHNVSALSANMSHIAKKPASYYKNYGISSGYDKEKLKADLGKNTFGMERVINNFVDQLHELKVKDASHRK
jgi:hypothetical protein